MLWAHMLACGLHRWRSWNRYLLSPRGCWYASSRKILRNVADVAGLRWVNEHFLGWRQESPDAPKAVTCGLWDFERSWRKNLPALQVVLSQ